MAMNRLFPLNANIPVLPREKLLAGQEDMAHGVNWSVSLTEWSGIRKVSWKGFGRK
jgi:hypothetical protein